MRGLSKIRGVMDRDNKKKAGQTGSDRDRKREERIGEDKDSKKG